MADAVHKTIKEFTGTDVTGCPWFALQDPFVSEVLTAHKWFDKGQLLTFAPDADPKLVAGVSFYDSVSNAVSSKKLQLSIEESRRRRGD